jgi:hypothetical protein
MGVGFLRQTVWGVVLTIRPYKSTPKNRQKPSQPNEITTRIAPFLLTLDDTIANFHD